MNVSVLGTDYEIIWKKYDEDEAFARLGCDGYCEGLTKRIVVCDMDTYKGYENESDEVRRASERAALRHEIVHAFFNESGLAASAHPSTGAFSLDEELIDWIALQGEKIYATWAAAGCLDQSCGESLGGCNV